MVTNFDYLKKEPKFSRFVDVAISAEKLILIDPEASILNSRRAMEFALKWMYSVDSELEMPYRDNQFNECRRLQTDCRTRFMEKDGLHPQKWK